MAELQKPTEFFSKDEIDSLRIRNPWKASWLVLHAWGTIVLVWVACCVWPHPLLIALGVLIVGTRQLGLFVIGHDAAHYLLYNNRTLNDWVAEWLCNRPALGASIVPYRTYHLTHHRFTQQDGDPDLGLSAPFPITGKSLWRKLIRDLTGQTGWKQHTETIRRAFGKPGDGFQARLRRGMRRLGPNLLINLMFLAGFVLAGHWYLYFLLWVLPFFTWQLLVTRLRNIAEHAVVPDNNDRLRNTRTTRASWIARIFLAPYYVNYHLEHHLLVSAPCYNLPRAHAMLLAKGLEQDMEIQPDYFSVLRLAASA